MVSDKLTIEINFRVSHHRPKVHKDPLTFILLIYSETLPISGDELIVLFIEIIVRDFPISMGQIDLSPSLILELRIHKLLAKLILKPPMMIEGNNLPHSPSPFQYCFIQLFIFFSRLSPAKVLTHGSSHYGLPGTFIS